MTTPSGSASANCGASFPIWRFASRQPRSRFNPDRRRGGAEFRRRGRVTGRRRAVSFDLGREMPDFAIDPPVHTTQRLLCSTEQASLFLRQFEAVTRIETLQLRRMLKGVSSEGEVRLAVRALKSWLKKRDLLLEAK
jgi:hypothetical protein